jgi:hypothetical protein
MIRTHTTTQDISFPKAGWLSARIRSVIVSRISRSKSKPKLVASPEQKKALQKHFNGGKGK